MKKNKEEFSIRDLVSLFVPKIWLIVLVALVLSLALGVYSAFIKKDTYSSTATMLVANDASSLNSSVIDVSTEMVERCEVVIFSDQFLLTVSEDLKRSGWDISASEISASLSMKQQGDTEYFDITATTTSAERSYVIVSAVSARIESDLPSRLPYDEKYIRTGTTDPAVAAVVPDSKHVMRNAIIGFAVGAILAMVAIFVYSLFDVTIRDKKKIEDNFDIPVLGVIPKFISEEGSK